LKARLVSSYNFRTSREDKPQSKEDFQRLYAKLESWRMRNEKKISEHLKPGKTKLVVGRAFAS
jgi:hypothetical protein